MSEMIENDIIKGLEPIAGSPVAPAHGIAAIALNMALKYHDIATVQDGTLYQQYKLEGKNFETLHLDMVFETAIKIEAHLLGASERIAKIVVDCIAIAVEDDEPEASTYCTVDGAQFCEERSEVGRCADCPLRNLADDAKVSARDPS